MDGGFVGVAWRKKKRRPPPKYNWGGATRQRYPCRCGRKACEKRVTLAKHPDEYVRTPKCRSCKKPGTLRIDRHRMKAEWGVRPCRCFGYSFPHAKGRGYCDHNPRLTAADLQERQELCRWR